VLGVACAGNPPVVETTTASTPAPAYTTKTIGGNLWAVPSSMNLEQFPVLGHKLTQDEQIRLKLRLARLEKDQVCFNENRRRHAFPAEVVKADTLVWVDKEGTVRYLESCGNRAELVEQSTKPVTTTPIVSAGGATNNEKSKGLGFGWLLDAILGLLALGLLLAILMLIGAGLYWLYKQLYNLFNRPTTPAPPIPATPPVVAPTPSPTTPPETPAPAMPIRTVRHFGPFKTLRIEDKGFSGYWVIGDGHPIGIFKDPVTTEDAGVNGHYVVVSS